MKKSGRRKYFHAGVLLTGVFSIIAEFPIGYQRVLFKKLTLDGLIIEGGNANEAALVIEILPERQL